MNGRRLHKWVNFCSVLALAMVPGVWKDALAENPNVLFIAVDDLNDWVGCLGGHPQVETPNIDRLAARGLLFTNAHCAAPACNPSRAALFSGRMPFRTGVWSNSSPRLHDHRPDLTLLPEAFRKADYTTLGTGKLLHGGAKTNRGLYDHNFYPEQRWSPLRKDQVGYTDEELPTKKSDEPRHRVEFEDGGSVILPLNRMPSDRRPDTPEGESFDWGPWDVPDSEMGDVQITDWAIQRIQEGFESPFFMAVGYYRPHIPLWVPKKYFETYPTEKTELPPYKEDDLEDLGPLGKRFALEAVTGGRHETVLRFGQWKEAVSAYLACVSFIDHHIGRLLDSLDSSTYGGNTWIVLWSDHGWHLGEKQHWGKWTGWERSTRVPLIIVPPEDSMDEFSTIDKTCDQPVSLIDLYPTLVEVCELEDQPDLDGTSLVPLLRNPELTTDRSVITTFDPGNIALRTDRWRYIKYEDGSEELYDHTSDPNEWKNLAKIPIHQSRLEEFRTEVLQVNSVSSPSP